MHVGQHVLNGLHHKVFTVTSCKGTNQEEDPGISSHEILAGPKIVFPQLKASLKSILYTSLNAKL